MKQVRCTKNKQIHAKNISCDIPKMSYLPGSISSMVWSIYAHRENCPGNKLLIIWWVCWSIWGSRESSENKFPDFGAGLSPTLGSIKR